MPARGSIGRRLAALGSTAGKEQDEAASLLGMLIVFLCICLIPLGYSLVVFRYLGANPEGALYVIVMLVLMVGLTWLISHHSNRLMNSARANLTSRLRCELRETDVLMLAMEEETWLRLREIQHGNWLWRWLVPDLPMTPEQQLRAAALMHPALLCIARAGHSEVPAASRRCMLSGIMHRLWSNSCLGCVLFPLLPLFLFSFPLSLPLLFIAYSCQMRVRLTLIEYCELLEEATPYTAGDGTEG